MNFSFSNKYRFRPYGETTVGEDMQQDTDTAIAKATGGGLSVPHDPVNHPSHYTSHPSGVECIQITEHMGFNIGNTIKYLWRAGLKSDNPVEDLRKAAWYITREISRLEKQNERV